MKISFARGKWDHSDWEIVKSSRWSYVNAFEQEDDHIVNPCAVWDDETLYRDHVTEVYASLLHKRTFTGT